MAHGGITILAPRNGLYDIFKQVAVIVFQARHSLNSIDDSWSSPSDNARQRIQALNVEQRKDTSDELYVLGFIAGLCQQQPRDVVLLDDMLMYLREAQELRRQSPNFS